MLRTPIKLNRPVTTGAMNSNAHLSLTILLTVDLLDQKLFATKPEKIQSNQFRSLEYSSIIKNFICISSLHYFAV